jgi:hypothetical protein
MGNNMKRIIAPVLLAMPVMAWAAAFDGTWVGDVASTKIEGKPDTYLLQNGQFVCDQCQPGLTVPADGNSHKVNGHSYYDEVTVAVLDPQSVKMSTMQGGKKSYERTMTVSADGKTLTDNFVNYQAAKPEPAKFIYTRVKAGPAGAHAISGSWEQDTKNSTMSADLITTTFQETSDGLKMTTPTGQSYDAKYDGKEYLTAGDPGKTMVSLKHLGPREIQETDKRDGKVTDIVTMQVSADGQTMHVVDDDKQHSIKMTYSAKKKS